MRRRRSSRLGKKLPVRTLGMARSRSPACVVCVLSRCPLRLVERMYASGKPVAAVCHGVAALRDARGPFGLPLVRGKDVTGFSDSEERAAGLAEAVPFLVEEALKEAGGNYSRAADWQSHVVTSGNLITGQNPASSAGAAKAVLEQLRQQHAQAA